MFPHVCFPLLSSLITFNWSHSPQSPCNLVPHLLLVHHDYSVPLFIGSPCFPRLYLSSLVVIVPRWFLSSATLLSSQVLPSGLFSVLPPEPVLCGLPALSTLPVCL
ncbi:hypothetical protein GOODEAATRI_028139 [Goodea atripinnis]|uniref:Uncharacterized protein n=1 Tax=Goodea atripinnis TaxID=208336 RepID=A0ABV0PSC2_9TELE